MTDESGEEPIECEMLWALGVQGDYKISNLIIKAHDQYSSKKVTLIKKTLLNRLESFVNYISCEILKIFV